MYRSLIEIMADGFAHCRMVFENGQPKDFICLEVNPAFEKLTGLREAAGKKAGELLPGIRESDPGLFENLGRVTLSGQPGQFETFVGALNHWLRISVYSPDKEHFVAVFNDITERKRAEAALALQARVANIFLTAPDDEMFNQVLEVILEVMQSPFGVFGFIDADGANVVLTMTRQIRNECQVPEKMTRFPRETWGDSSWCRAIGEKRVIRSNEPSAKIPAGHVPIQRHISLPLLFRGEVIGLFQVANRETDYTEADVRKLAAIAGHVAPLLSARLRREAAEAALRESEKKFRALFESSRDAIMTLEPPSYRFTCGNPVAVKIFGAKNEEEFISLRPWELSPEQQPDGRASAEKAMEMIETAMREGSHFFEWTHRRIGGEEFLANVLLTRMEHGGKPLLQATVRDITEQMRAQRALRESHKLYSSLVENMPQSVFRKDREGRFVFCNRQFCGAAGGSLEALVGKTDADFFPPALAQAYRRDDLRVMNSGQPLDQVEEHVGADGRKRFVHVVKTPLYGAAGVVIGVQGIFWDVTEKKQAEEQLRKLARAVEQSPVSIVITNREGRIEFVNPKFTQVTGYTLDEVLGANPRILKSGQTPPGTYRRLWETLTAGQEWRGEFQNRRKDGTLFWETASISPVRDPAGEITHFIAVKEDVTEQKLTEAKLLRLQRLEGIGSLATGIAHDLNNILSPITMCVPLLREKLPNDQRKQMLSLVEASTQRAVSIVKQLLSISRGQAGGQKTALQVRYLIREVCKIARETFPRSIQVEEDLAANLWVVTGDATQLHQALLNLCVNARDAMPSGGKLTLRAQNVPLHENDASVQGEVSAGPFIRIQVQDTGTGISESAREHIFDSFFTTKSQDQGIGLGLTTALGIVKHHHGFITFTTAEGKGTTFEIHLPATPEAQPSAPPEQPLTLAPRGCGELILLVDDEPSVCAAARGTLERHGYAVLQAQDGIEALAHFTPRQTEIRAVVMDFMMPEMDGVMLSRTLRRLSPRTPIIISSGGLLAKDAGDSLQTFRALGIRHILHKPHNAEVLLQALNEVLHPATQEPREGIA